MEPLEPRRFLSASLKVQNLDEVPGYERMFFNRIRTPDAELGNYVKERGTLRLTNVGDETLRFSDVKIEGPFRILGMAPQAIPPGKSVHVTVQFTATTPPPFTYNQTIHTNNMRNAGAWIGSMTFKTNDPNNTTYVEGLAGWFQMQSEKDHEPNLQTIINLVSDYKTKIADGRITNMPQPDDKPGYYGEEVISGYWQSADPSKPVRVRHLSSFKSVGEEFVRLSYFFKSDKVAKSILLTDGRAAQSFLPHVHGQPGTPAKTTFGPGSNVFGFRIDQSHSDDTLNKVQLSGGHQVRFYPARDHFGKILVDTYFMAMDYAIQGFRNSDFQDNVYIIANVKPAGN